MPELSLVTTKELAEELERRYEHFIFVAKVQDTDEEDQIEYWSSEDDEFVQIGLLLYQAFCLAMDIYKDGRTETTAPG